MPAPPEQLDLFIQYDAIDIYIRMGDFQFLVSFFYPRTYVPTVSYESTVELRSRARESSSS